MFKLYADNQNRIHCCGRHKSCEMTDGKYAEFIALYSALSASADYNMYADALMLISNIYIYALRDFRKCLLGVANALGERCILRWWL